MNNQIDKARKISELVAEIDTINKKIEFATTGYKMRTKNLAERNSARLY